MSDGDIFEAAGHGALYAFVLIGCVVLIVGSVRHFVYWIHHWIDPQ